MKYPTSFKDKRYPEFMHNNLILKAYSNPIKAFPRIGLPNCEMSISSLKPEVLKPNKWKALFDKINACIDGLHFADSDISNTRDDMYIDIDDLKTMFSDHEDDEQFNIGPDGIEIGEGTKFRLLKNKPTTNLITIVKALQTYSKKHKLGAKEASFRALENLKLTPPAKGIIPNECKPFMQKGLKVVFSSDGPQGCYDIATMSMRGIQSCMRWESDHAPRLIGTIVDPYAAVIYITDGSNMKYGSKMLARSVVRLVQHVGAYNGKLSVLIENPYVADPSSGHNRFDSTCAVSSSIFKSFIEAKLGNVKVHTAKYQANLDFEPMIPLTEPVEDIFEIDENLLSCIDSGGDYSSSNTQFYDPAKLNKTVFKKNSVRA